MNLLVISTVDPCPPSDGVRIPVYELVRRLALRHNVTLATFVDSSIDRPDVTFYAQLAESVRLPTRKQSNLLMPHHWPTALWGLPASVFPYLSPDAIALVENVMYRNSIDATICHLIHPAALIPDWMAKRSCVVVQDVIHNVIRSEIVNERRPWKRIYLRHQSRIMKRYEARQYRRFAARCVVSAAEQRRAAMLAAGPTAVIPNGVSTEFFTQSIGVRRNARILYLGALDAPRNEHAAWRLATEILPLVRRAEPSASLWVIGRRPSSRLLALSSSCSYLTVTGEVESVPPYLAQGAVLVSPQITGTGLKNSILQAMAAGVPVVATPEALEGVLGTPDRHYLVAESSLAIANHVISVLQDDNLAAGLSSSARELVEANYSWDAYTANIESLLRSTPS